MLVSCGWSRYATAVNRDTKILATKSWYNFPFLDISLFEKVIWCFTFVISCLQYFWCKFSINSCKILWKIKKHLLRTKGIAHHFPVFVNIVQCKCSPSFIFFFLPEMTRVSLYSFAVWLSVFAMYCRSPPTQKDPVWPAC